MNLKMKIIILKTETFEKHMALHMTDMNVNKINSLKL